MFQHSTARSTCPRLKTRYSRDAAMSDAAHSAVADAERESAPVAWVRKRGAAIIVFVLLFLAWELAVRVTGIKEYLLPPPSRVYTEFIKRLDPVMASAWVTTREIIAGYLLAIVVSVPPSFGTRNRSRRPSET